MKRVAVTGAGGSPAIGFARSLRSAPENFISSGSIPIPTRCKGLRPMSGTWFRASRIQTISRLFRTFLTRRNLIYCTFRSPQR